MIVQFSRCLKKFFSSFIIAALSDSFNIISYFQAFVNTFFEVFSKSFFSLGSSVSAFFRQRSLLYHFFSSLSIPFLNFFKSFFRFFRSLLLKLFLNCRSRFRLLRFLVTSSFSLQFCGFRSPSRVSLIIISPLPPFVNTFFPLFSPFYLFTTFLPFSFNLLALFYNARFNVVTQQVCYLSLYRAV